MVVCWAHTVEEAPYWPICRVHDAGGCSSAGFPQCSSGSVSAVVEAAVALLLPQSVGSPGTATRGSEAPATREKSRLQLSDQHVITGPGVAE